MAVHMEAIQHQLHHKWVMIYQPIMSIVQQHMNLEVRLLILIS